MNNVRITGIPKRPGPSVLGVGHRQIVTLVNKHLGTTINSNDIDIAQWLGKLKPNNNRPVIVRFVRSTNKDRNYEQSEIIPRIGHFCKRGPHETKCRGSDIFALKQPSAVKRSWSLKGSYTLGSQGANNQRKLNTLNTISG
ncbi:hypothetical protein DPMN_163468 [Dreissena polymorpha]|uniref:Uncharacterized protein n=1 Tax=Dreissena polymorpha TaxID=45954 RepID=A0A9D4ES14_DREPO|nr:hypothetical protein DPMN_163468 [Dreissena polymorpha]